MKKSHIFLRILFFIGLVSMSFLVTHKTLDPDFGWHLRTGQLILERGVPHQDWYSYTMPNFPWIDHEWLTDVLIYNIYSYFGDNILLLIFLCMYTLSFFIVKGKNYNLAFFIFITSLAYLTTLSFLGVRPQLLTIFFIAILWNIVDKFLESSSKFIYFLPLLFMVWTNLHAGFFAGLFILSLVLFLEIFKKCRLGQKFKFLHFLNHFYYKEQPTRKIAIIGAVIIFSFLATTINPYGLRIYEEIFRTIGDSYLKFHIAEWFPLLLIGYRPFTYVYISLFLVFLISCYKKVEFNNIVISLIVFLMAFSSIRNYLIFVILSIPVFNQMFFYIKEKIILKEVYYNLSLVSRFHKRLLFLAAMIFLASLEVGFYKSVTGDNEFRKDRYPEKAVSFLKTLPLSENVFNDYKWGGYLIWKLPERKVFIDGRMPSWREHRQFVFGDYINIFRTKDGFENTIDKYHITLFMLPKDTRTNLQKDQTGRAYDKFTKIAGNHTYLANMLCFIAGCSKKNIYDELHKLGWKTVYQDDVAVILKK